MPDLASVIRTIRKRLGLTQAAFADLIEARQNTISQYETGRIVPSRSVLRLLLGLAVRDERLPVLAALGVSAEDVGDLPDDVVQHAIDQFDRYISTGGTGAVSGHGGPELFEFARAAMRILSTSHADFSPAITDILNKWIEFGSEPRTHELFENAALYLDVELRPLKAARKNARVRNRRSSKRW